MRRFTKVALGLTAVPITVAAAASLFVDVWHEVPSAEADPSIHVEGRARVPEQHDDIYSKAGALYEVSLKHGEGEILLIGTKHTTDPDSEQVKRIIEAFETFKPDVALLESRLGLFIGNLPMGVKQFGEAGAVYGMCRNLSIPCKSFEPSREQEAEFLLEEFSREEVAFALFFRTYLSDRNAGAIPDAEAARLLQKKQRQYGLTGALPTLAEADACWREKLEQDGDWRSASAESFYPVEDGTRLQQIARRANLVRDDHLIRSLLTELRAGKKVLAVAGMSHVINYEPVLVASAEQLK